MINKTIIFLGGLATTLLFADEVAKSDLRAKIKQFYGDVISIEADIVLNKQSELFDGTINSRVKLRYKDTKLIWEVLSPVPYKFEMTSGDENRNPRAAVNDNLASVARLVKALIKADFTTLEKNMLLQITSDKSFIVVKGAAKKGGAAPFFSEVILTLNHQYLIQSAELVAPGERSMLKFENVRIERL